MQRPPGNDHRDTGTGWLGVGAGFSAVLVGIGLSRFAYTPLIPAIVELGWFSASQAAYAGAANLAGYLAGALLGLRLTARLPAAVVLRAMMLLAAVAFIACAWPFSFAWFSAWRFAAGLSGGALMVLAAPTVLPQVPAEKRGLAGGIIFAGVGLGIAASGTLVPALLRLGLFETWIALGAGAGVLTLAVWRAWPQEPAATATPVEQATPPPAPVLPLRLLCLQYGLNAAGLVPHMVFLVDHIARGLERGLSVGALYWVVFGLGAIAGPVAAGLIADRIGFKRALRAAFLVQALAVGLIVVSDSALALIVSSAVVGAAVPGVVPLVLGRVTELVGHDPAAAKRGWTAATVTFALGQAVAAYAYSFLLSQTGGDYAPIFAIAVAALLAALLIDLVRPRRAAP